MSHLIVYTIWRETKTHRVTGVIWSVHCWHTRSDSVARTHTVYRVLRNLLICLFIYLFKSIKRVNKCRQRKKIIQEKQNRGKKGAIVVHGMHFAQCSHTLLIWATNWCCYDKRFDWYSIKLKWEIFLFFGIWFRLSRMMRNFVIEGISKSLRLDLSMKTYKTGE